MQCLALKCSYLDAEGEGTVPGRYWSLLSGRAWCMIHLYRLPWRFRLPLQGARPHPVSEANLSWPLLEAAHLSSHLETRLGVQMPVVAAPEASCPSPQIFQKHSEVYNDDD